MTPTRIGAHRCLRIGPFRDAKGEAHRPPLVLLGGTAQTIESWVGHSQALARDRELVIPELRGQGKQLEALDVDNVCLPRQVEDLEALLSGMGLVGGAERYGGDNLGTECVCGCGAVILVV